MKLQEYPPTMLPETGAASCGILDAEYRPEPITKRGGCRTYFAQSDDATGRGSSPSPAPLQDAAVSLITGGHVGRSTDRFARADRWTSFNAVRLLDGSLRAADLRRAEVLRRQRTTPWSAHR